MAFLVTLRRLRDAVLRACLKSIKTPSRHIFFRWATLTWL